MPKDMGVVRMIYKITRPDGTVLSEGGTSEEPATHQVETYSVALLLLPKKIPYWFVILQIDEDEIVPPVLEMALKKMKAGGKSELRIESSYCGEGEEGPLTGELQLVSFENEKDSWDLEEPEKLAVAEAKKEAGNVKLKAGDLDRALRRYEAAKTVLASDYKMDDEQKEKCKAIKVVVFTNMAMVHAKKGNMDEVLKAADEALKLGVIPWPHSSFLLSI
eukprot:SAG31_NODE_2575_length_5453_cov_7.045013_7_plen_219_part_00